MDRSDLHNYQEASAGHIIETPHCGLFLDMGLGKTVSTLTAVDVLINDLLDISTALVIAPKRVAESVWDAEIKKWDHLKHLKISKVIGKPKEREAALKAKADIYIIGRDNVAWLCGLYGGNMLPFDMLIIDESSSFKSPKSMRFKALKRVQPSFSRVVILTGTPAPNGLMDLWSQVYLLDRGERLGKTITTYRHDFFSPGARNGHIIYKYELRKGAEDMIHEAIGDICMSMKAKDYLKLPERIDNYIDITFPDSIQKKYDDFEREQVLELMTSPEGITALSTAGLSNKLLQFANGAVYDSEGNYHEVHSLKLDALEEIVENLNGKPVLVAYTYRHDVERIMERLKKYNPVKLSGDADIRAWNRGEIQVLVMHPASGGHGLNLQEGGSDIIWFGQTWSLELFMQLNARLHRQGQKFMVRIHHLIANRTIDMDVKKAIERKDQKQEGLMQAVKARIDKYKKSFST